MPEKFDVVIVGAGPAGSTAAFTAAEQGISVLLLEEHAEVGIPVACAEGLKKSMLKDYLDIRPEWVSQDISRAIIRGPDGEEFKVECPGCGWILNRMIFDQALAKIAEVKGAVIKTSAKAIRIDGNEVVVAESGKENRYKFTLLIGADGIGSHVGKWMGIDTRLSMSEIGVCAEYLIEAITTDPHCVKLIVGHEYAPGGYAWVFPKSTTSANIGVLISPRKAEKSAKHFLDNWVRREFPDGMIKKKTFGGAPAKILKKFSGKNFFLIGDAARLTDPLSGAGIANAIKSGVIAGRNVILRLKGKKDYFTEDIDREILHEIRFHHRVRRGYLRLTDAEYKVVFNLLKKHFHGKIIAGVNTRQLVKELLFFSPRVLRICFDLLF